MYGPERFAKSHSVDSLLIELLAGALFVPAFARTGGCSQLSLNAGGIKAHHLHAIGREHLDLSRWMPYGRPVADRTSAWFPTAIARNDCSPGAANSDNARCE